MKHIEKEGINAYYLQLLALNPAYFVHLEDTIEERMTTTTTKSPSTVKASVSSVEQKEFNNGFPSLNDPEEFLGVWQKQFSTNFVYTVPQDKIEQVYNDILQAILHKLRFNSLGDCQFRRIDYRDNKYKFIERPRYYILIEKETVRATHLTVVLKVITMGDNLYVSIESYVLGSLDYSSLRMNIALTIGSVISIFVLLSYIFIDGLSVIKFFIFCFLFFIGGIFTFAWKDTVRAWFNHNDIELALRQTHLGRVNYHSFNIDDMMMFFKSTLPLIIYSIQDVFEKHDIPIRNLEQFSQNIMNVTTVTNDNGVMNFKNVILGNTIKNTRMEG